MIKVIITITLVGIFFIGGVTLYGIIASLILWKKRGFRGLKQCLIKIFSEIWIINLIRLIKISALFFLIKH